MRPLAQGEMFINKMDGTADNNMGRLQKGVEIENVSHRKTQRIF